MRGLEFKINQGKRKKGPYEEWFDINFGRKASYWPARRFLAHCMDLTLKVAVKRADFPENVSWCSIAFLAEKPENSVARQQGSKSTK